jgi:nucleotide-binding universal stress UspA family protein
MINKILFATDFSTASQAILGYAADVTRVTQSMIIGTCAFEVPQTVGSLRPDVNGLLADLKGEYTQKLEEFFSHPSLAGVKVDVKLANGVPIEAIGSFLVEEKADVSMVARHRRSTVESFFLGADTEKILRLASQPIWMVPERGLKTLRWSPVVCAVDFSHVAEQALDFAIRFVKAYGSPLTVVHVMPLGLPLEAHEDRLLQHISSTLEQRKEKVKRLLSINGAPADTDVVITQGNVAGKLLEVAARRKTDLLILGIHGKHIQPVKGLGSTANAVLRLADFPVILHPARLPTT